MSDTPLVPQVSEQFGQVADQERVKKAINSLQANGFSAEFVATAKDARDKVVALIPEGSEVMSMQSRTLEETGLYEILNKSGKFQSIREKLNSRGKVQPDREMKGLAYSPSFAVGSVHALTEDGHALVASNTGSQIPAYVYGADQVIWVVGAQKIVKDVNEGIKRIYEYSLPLEDERLFKAIGIHSAIRNILIKYSTAPERIKIVIVGEKLGF